MEFVKDFGCLSAGSLIGIATYSLGETLYFKLVDGIFGMNLANVKTFDMTIPYGYLLGTCIGYTAILKRKNLLKY